MKHIAVVVVAVVLGLTGCGGDDSSSSGEPAEPDDAQTEGGSGESSGGTSNGSASAEVTVGGQSYEFTESDGCDVDGDNVLVGFSDGMNVLSLTSTGDVVLVRVTVDGTEWVDTGSAEAPTVSGSTAEWSGEMAEFGAGDSRETVAIEVTC